MLQYANFREELYGKPRLKQLFFELTDCCNLSCMHCGSKCSPKNATYLDKNLIFNVLKDVEEAYGTDEILICITGGEPMLHPDFFEIIRKTDEMGFRWGMTTNATLIDKEAAEKIIKAHITSVSFSLDGTKDAHNFLRQSATAFDRCLEGIKNLIKFGDYFVSMITTVIHKQNIDLMDDIFDTVSALGVDIWRLTPIDPIGHAKKSGLLLENDDYFRLFDYIKRRREGNTAMEVTTGCAHYLGEKYEEETRKGCFLCGAGLYAGSVSCNGDITACLDIERLPYLAQGNVKRDSFVDIWENKFEFFRKNRAYLNKECAECADREYCAGDSAHTWDYEENKPKFCIKKGGNANGND